MMHADFAPVLRRLGARSLATMLALTLTTHSYAAQTDIASTPLLATTSALVKPNIMLLMDASGSMGRTHMPDEVETQTGPTSIGYKSAQCNVLYYNPATSYYLPKDSLGAPFLPPAFNSAPYAGFGAYYSPPDSHVPTDLGSKFVAYDGSTLDVVPPYPDTPQAAYYFVYTGTVTPLNFAQAPCTAPDNSAPNVGAIIPTTGGTWTKVIVSTLSTAEQSNFAVWYSFYRTRLSLIKSAASLAFSPLNDTKRVGFITVEPKDTRTSPAINPIRYLPLNDFNSTQKDLWFKKVFSQVPHGASPAREGLARVGRYYAGRDEAGSINEGMPATGAADPIQYACQQNFTIMTTDGYWNGQSETPTNGVTHGGGLQIDGITKVGQQDGDSPDPAHDCPLSDPYCPRPIFDGVSASTRVVTNKTNAYTDNICSLAGKYRSTYQTRREVTNLTRDTSRTTNHTVQYKTYKRQAVAKTSQTIQKVTQTQQTTTQYAKHKRHYDEDHYQHVKWQEQTTQVSQQWELTTSQTVAQTFQTVETKTKIRQIQDQWSTSTSQSVSTTTQYRVQKEQYKYGRVQIKKHSYQTIAYDHSDEHGDAIPGDCVASPGNYPIECRITEVFPEDYVDPATCTTGTAPTITGPNNTKTTCIPGPQSLPYQAVPSCVPGPPAGPGNGWVVTTCDHLILDPYTPIDGTCSPTPVQTGATDYFIYVCDRPPANNTSTPVASCGTDTPGTMPDYITTVCSKPVGPNNQPLTPSAQCDDTAAPKTDGDLVTTTCVKTLHTDGNVGSCGNNPGTSMPYIQVQCFPSTVSSMPVASAACSPGTDGANVITTCDKNPAGPDATAHGSITCVNGSSSNSPDYFEQSCTQPAGANNKTDFVTQATCGAPGVTPPTGPDFVTRDCHQPAGPNNGTQFNSPTLCIPDNGTAYPYLTRTCTPGPTVPPFPPTVIDPYDTAQNGNCTTFGTTIGPGPDFIVTHCDKNDLSNSPVKGCTPAFSGPPDYIVTTCGPHDVDEAVNFCVLGPLPDEGVDTVTCIQIPGPNNATTNVASCSPTTLPDFVHVTCNGPTTISEGAVDPSTCKAGTGTDANVYVTTCTENPAGLYPTETGVAWPCVGGYDSGTQITTTCSTPTATNTGEVNSPPCDDKNPSTDGDQITTFCKKYDDTNYVETSTCPADVIQAGSGPAITCTTNYTYAEPVSVCDSGHVDGPPYHDTTQACHPDVKTPMADYAGICVPGPGSVLGEVISCDRRPLDVLVADSGCTPGTDAATGIITECTPQFGVGHHYTVITKKTVTTTPYSGTVATGPDDVQTTYSGSTDVGAACYQTAQLVPSDPDPAFPAQPPVDVASCTVWPCTKTTVGDGGSENSLADVAQYYYKTDLRTSGPHSDNAPDRIGGPEDDKAGHQHMTTFTLGLGVSGTLQYRSDYRSTSTVTGDFADIRTGAKNWPLWPDKNIDYTNSDNYNNPKSIDDFWHTAVDGRGRYFSANNPTSVIQGLGDALANIDAVTASGAAIGTSTLSPVNGNNFAYASSYHSGTWDGDLQASLIDVGTGLPGAMVWSAKALLGAKTFDICDNRKILLMRGGNTLVDFTWNTVLCPSGPPGGGPVTSLNATEQAFFGPLNVMLLSQYPYMTDGTGTTAMQQQEAKKPGKLVNFLRGQTANENFSANSLTQLFRARDGALGDIVGSQPVYVKQPFADYADPGYSAFKAAARTAMVYVGANDGMLHAFYADVDTTAPHGQEAWAVIPSAVLPNMYKLADDNYKRDGHQFFVDGTPVVGDVFAGSWKTILVGSLNAGGKGYFALDVSNPGATPTALWEFKQDAASCPGSPTAATGNTGDCNLGLSFGKPVITKLAGTWVVMFTSGYNNVNGAGNGADGQGFLYVLNAMSGAIIYKIPTGAGDAGTPSGLGQINNFVDNVLIDNTTIRVYGGDVLGNMWRFDFLPSPTATLLGSAKDLASAIQPITIRPEIAELDGKPFVMFGTGKLLGGSDVTDLHVGSVYGFRDPLIGASPIYADPIRNVLKPLKINTTPPGLKKDGVTPDYSTVVRTIACTGSTADCGRPTGWVLDLAEAGERVNVEMKLVVGALVFASNVPSPQPCTVIGHSYFNQIDFRTGAPIPNAVSTEFLADSINVGFTVLQLTPPSGGTNPEYVGIFRQGDASNVRRQITPPEPTFLGKRISWREIAQP